MKERQGRALSPRTRSHEANGTIDLEGECQHAREVAVFTAPHENRAAAHLTVYRGILEQLEQVEIDAFPTAFVTKRQLKFSRKLADRFGGKVPLIMTASGIILAAIVQCTTNHTGVFILSRVIIGCAGTGGAGTSGTMLVELAHPRIRSVASALNLCNYYVGSIIASWVTFGTLQHFPQSSWSWRLPSLLQGLVPAPILISTILIPQSPRWLMGKGRTEEARQTLAKQHANGHLQDPLVVFEMQEIEEALAAERAVNHGTRSLFAGFTDFFKTPGNMKRLFILVNIGFGLQWNGVGIVSYYLVPVLKSVGIESPTKQTLATGGLAISNLCFPVAGAKLVERLGGRPLWLIPTGPLLYRYNRALVRFVKTNSAAAGAATVAFLCLYYGSESTHRIRDIHGENHDVETDGVLDQNESNVGA